MAAPTAFCFRAFVLLRLWPGGIVSRMRAIPPENRQLEELGKLLDVGGVVGEGLGHRAEPSASGVGGTNATERNGLASLARDELMRSVGDRVAEVDRVPDGERRPRRSSRGQPFRTADRDR